MRRGFRFNWDQARYASPKDQMGFFTGASSVSQKDAIIPPTDQNYFKQFTFKYLGEYLVHYLTPCLPVRTLREVTEGRPFCLAIALAKLLLTRLDIA